MVPQIAMFQIASLQRTADDLQNRLDNYTMPDPPAPEDAHLIAGYSLTILILRALATELALKALFCIQNNGQQQSKIHDLSLLYKKLDGDSKAKIAKYGKDRKIDVVRVLETHKNAIVDWRYFADLSNNLHANCLDLDKALGVIVCVVDDYQPVQR